MPLDDKDWTNHGEVVPLSEDMMLAANIQTGPVTVMTSIGDDEPEMTAGIIFNFWHGHDGEGPPDQSIVLVGPDEDFERLAAMLVDACQAAPIYADAARLKQQAEKN